MHIWYADEPYRPPEGQRSLFLAGPTPRSADVPSWRPEALDVLEHTLAFAGVVWVPETASGRPQPEYDHQVEWEYVALHAADVIVFWVPRELRLLPGFTTNVEFGYWMAASPGKVVYGRPKESAKNRYLDWMYSKKTGRSPHENLLDTLRTAVGRLDA